MNHADFHMVRLQPPELVREALPDLRGVPGPLVLPVLPDGAEMGLEDELLPPPPERPAQIGTKVRVGRVEVDAVDPRRLAHVQPFPHLLRGLFQKALAAHADLPHPEAAPAQRTISHILFLLVFSLVRLPA